MDQENDRDPDQLVVAGDRTPDLFEADGRMGNGGFPMAIAHASAKFETIIEWLKVPGASVMSFLISLDLWSVSSASLKQVSLLKIHSNSGNSTTSAKADSGPDAIAESKDAIKLVDTAITPCSA